jgi:hypothetical protein
MSGTALPSGAADNEQLGRKKHAIVKINSDRTESRFKFV